MTIHNFFFIFGTPASGIFLAVVNIDRLIAVAWPIVNIIRLYSSFLIAGLLQVHTHVQPRPNHTFLSSRHWQRHRRLYYYVQRQSDAQVRACLLYELQSGPKVDDSYKLS